MKLTFLGTGSADWKPSDKDTRADYRRNTSLLIDDTLLIDPGPTVLDGMQFANKSPDGVRFILNTHKHSDHYSIATVNALENATLVPMRAGEVKAVGKYTVTALPANHAVSTVHFLISDGERTLFYGLDGAWLLYEEFEAIKKAGVDLAILDATLGDGSGDYRVFEHNSLTMVRELKASLAPYVKRFLITHVSKNLSHPHDELVALVKPHGIEVAFDGMEIVI